MKNLSDISVFKKSLFFVLGALVAVLVVSQEVLDYHCSKLSAQLEEQQEGDDDNSETVIGLLSFNVMLPGNTFSLEPFSPVLIQEFDLEAPVHSPIPQKVTLDNTAFFKTLFRQIISPNAP